MSRSLIASHEVHARRPGWRRYLFSTDHKDIGTLYLTFGIFAGCVGSALSVLMRIQLFDPRMGFMARLAQWIGAAGPDNAANTARTLYGASVTAHGLIMIFFMVVPSMIGGFGNWPVPLMIGAPEMAFRRLNRAAFWLMPLAFVLVIVSMGMQGADAGRLGPAMDVLILGLLTAGTSSILNAINLITTIFNMRPPGMTLHKMPLFAWSMLVTAFMLVLFLPVMAGAATILLTAGSFGSSPMNPDIGGDPVLFGRMVWFVGYPAIAIMILPSFGIVTHIISTFSRRPVFGHLAMSYTMVALGMVGFLVWAHQMYTAVLSPDVDGFFLLAGLVIAVPTAAKIILWIATMWSGAVSMRTPMLWAVGFVLQITVGSLIDLAAVVAGSHRGVHDTYSVVAQFHYLLSLGTVFALFAGFYYWLPKMSGHMFDERLAKLQFWLMLLGANLTFFPQHVLGLAGMAPRSPDYPDAFSLWNRASSVGSFISGAAILLFLCVLVEAFARKRPAGANPWGQGATTLEWTLPSPPPYYGPGISPSLSPSVRP